MKILIVPNNELRSWRKIKPDQKSKIKIRPLYLKNLKKDIISVEEDYSKNVIEKFNVYMINATTNYEAGYKLRNSYEALALSNIIVIEEKNDYDVSLNDWNIYKNKLKKLHDFVLVQPEEKIKLKNIINDYACKVLKDFNALLYMLSKYKKETSTPIKLCLEILKNIDNVINNSWEVDGKKKEEDLFITNFVVTIKDSKDKTSKEQW
ncbi:hypothetical protein BDF21DRAFT_54744 [Thamnidium elegans]|nr:hypothetical protein BDF21DRAFT_54744 [Thamnidium elegans]